MAESTQQLELEPQGVQTQGGQGVGHCCIPIGCLTSTAAHHDPAAAPIAGHCCNRGLCSALLFVLGFIVLALEGLVAFAEFHERTLEQKESNCPIPTPAPSLPSPSLFHKLKAMKCPLFINVFSVTLFGLLIYKYVERGKAEGAHQKYYIFMYWRNPTTQRCSRLYGSALQLLGLLFVATHLGLSIWDTVAAFGVKIPRLGGFSVFPLLFAGFEACVRLVSLISDWWSPRVCYVYCPLKNTPPPQPQGEELELEPEQQQAQPQGEELEPQQQQQAQQQPQPQGQQQQQAQQQQQPRGQQQQQQAGALIETRRYVYEGTVWCWCAHEGCYEQQPDPMHGNIVYRQHPDLR